VNACSLLLLLHAPTVITLRVDVDTTRATPRRSLLGAVALTVLHPRAALAEYGQGANVALPAFVPSPIRPTGPMADTCEVVALGREDVCLEPKKLLTAYDQLLLDKARAALEETAESVSPRASPLIKAVLALIPLTESNRFSDIIVALAPLKEGSSISTLVAEDPALKPLATAIQASVSALTTACKKGEASPAARALIKLTKDVGPQSRS